VLPRTLFTILALLFCAAPAPGADNAAQQPAFPIFRVGGFADVELHTTSENEREGLDLVELDVFSNLQLSNDWSAFAEGVAQRSWRRNDEPRIETDLERAYVEYSPSDAFRLEIGQTQTGIIRWNEREHHSRFLQTPIDVPAIARRPQQDGAWPLRFIGGWASGRVPGSLGVTWGSGAGLGPGRARDSIPVFGRDRSPAALLSLSISPDSLPGFEVAAAAYAQEIHLGTERIHERDVTLSVNYVNSGTEVRGEWAMMKHRLGSTGTPYRTTGYYLLLSKRLRGPLERVRPYFMLDRLTLPLGEVYLQEATPERAWATGLRYDFTQHISIKGEYRSQRAPDGDHEDVFGLQFGVSF
jgi:hypothetical protein